MDNKIVISVGNVNSSILAPPHLLEKLRSTFAYEVEDASYIRDAKIAFYMKQNRPKDARKWAEWDGKFSVFSGFKFGTGILGDVMMYLYDNGYDVELIDQMEQPKPNEKLYDNYFRKNNKSKDILWTHQNDAVHKLIDNDFRGILQIATAGGKTIIACYVMSMLKVPTLIIVEKKEIMEQWINKINWWFTFAENKIKGASGRIWYSDDIPIIVLCTSRLLQSILSSKHSSKGNTVRNKMLKDFVKKTDLLIYDEVHHAAAREARKTISKIPAYYRIGLTATANIREDNADYEYLALMGNVVHHFTPTELVEVGKGTSIDIKILSPSYDPDWFKVITKMRSYVDIYDTFIVNNEVRNADILKAVIDEVENNNTIMVLVDRVAHARHLAASLGTTIADYTWAGDDTDIRRAKVASFKTGDVPAFFCTYSLGGEGFDYPELNALVLAGGKSETKIRQSLGRIMRLKADGSNATLYDFADTINPFRDHFIDRMKVYKSEDVFVVKEYPRWVKKYI
jgi:superfamily II DNA or RNA helicase